MNDLWVGKCIYIYFTIVWQFHFVFREEYSIKKTVLKNLNDYYSQKFLLRQKFFDFSVIANFEYPNHGKPSFIWRNDSLSDCRYKINCSIQYVIPLTLNTAHHNLYINDRAVLPTHLPHFMKKMLYCLPSPSFFKFCWAPFPVVSDPNAHCSFCCLVSLAEWVIAPHLICYFMLWIYTWCGNSTP